ncbi:hypothetical protein [Deinococcus kurensis]|uniref:hypothetical protein n=1 Tax=Deinococcus kurensis TaxID=2662757 RepID=UPI0012D3235B|nr:hypothetical protein [Deinococcus kurensis]
MAPKNDAIAKAFTRKPGAPRRPLEEPRYDLNHIRDTMRSHGVHWEPGVAIRDNLAQTTFRSTVALCDAVLKPLPSRTTVNDLYSTMAAMYLADRDFRDRVDVVLAARVVAHKHRDRHTLSASEEALLLDIDNPAIASTRDALTAYGIPWEADTTLRTDVKQASYRTTLSFKNALDKVTPAGVTSGDLHVTMSAMFVSDNATQLEVLNVLQARVEERARIR